MTIRETTHADLDDILAVERAAFGSEIEAELVRELLNDPSAQPSLSLLAFEGEKAVGHILFTRARLENADSSPSMSILAPLAVIPESQRKGIGGKLIGHGLRVLAASGVKLVFVLGHPGYYPRYGFCPAGCRGFEAPYPIPEKDADAWMVQGLVPGIIGTIKGKVLCADALDKPECWRE